MRPIETAVGVAWGLLLVSLLVVPLAIWGTGSIGGVGRGDPEVCVEAPPGVGVGWGGGDGERRGEWQAPVGLAEGIRYMPETIRYCDPSPDRTKQLLEGVRGLFPFAAALGFFWWFRRVLRQARTVGVFTSQVARGISVLGWYLIVWGSVQALAAGFIDAALVKAMAEEPISLRFVASGFPWSELLAGLGLVTLGRIMRQGVLLREDVEATI